MDLPRLEIWAELAELEENDGFVRRHIGPSETELGRHAAYHRRRDPR